MFSKQKVIIYWIFNWELLAIENWQRNCNDGFVSVVFDDHISNGM